VTAPDDLEVIATDARLRGIALSQALGELVAERAAQLRLRHCRVALFSVAFSIADAMESEADLARAAELQLASADLRPGLVDASTIALAERLNETRIATLDHRHFAMVRPRHCPHFTLLPE
jgi:predicted nucleic acid-binding protein